jgi:hypothetical protein
VNKMPAHYARSNELSGFKPYPSHKKRGRGPFENYPFIATSAGIKRPRKNEAV